MFLRRRRAKLLSGPTDRVDVRAWSHPENRRSAHPDKRQTPFGRDRWRRERLGDCHAEALGLLLLRTSPDNLNVGKVSGDALQEGGLAPVGLHQSHPPVWKRRGERYAGSASARADIHDRAIERTEKRYCGEAVFDVNTPCLVPIANRSQTRSAEQRVEPALEPWIVQAAGEMIT